VIPVVLLAFATILH